MGQSGDDLPVQQRDVPGAVPATRRQRGGEPLVLDGEQLEARRRNRFWLIAISAVTLAILVGALVASAVANSNQPKGPSIIPPPGYHQIRDSYFAYAVPSAWVNNPAQSDQTGDVVTAGDGGFAAEHIAFRATPSVAGEPQPAVLQAFGAAHPTPYTTSAATPLTVPGASVAFRYRVTRPGGFEAVLVNAYNYDAAVEIWLMIQAPPDVTARILSSLTG